MNAQKYTQKSLKAIQAAQQLTIENQNQQIEQVFTTFKEYYKDHCAACRRERLYAYQPFCRSWASSRV